MTSTDKPEGLTIAKVAFKWAKTLGKLISFPASYILFEFSQVVPAVALLGLLVRLPAGVWGTSLGGYGAWTMIRYVLREIIPFFRGKGRGPGSLAGEIVRNASMGLAAGNGGPSSEADRQRAEAMAMLMARLAASQGQPPAKAAEEESHGLYL